MKRPGVSDIDLGAAIPGMVLAAALLDAHGGVLIPQDTALTENTLAALRRRGVERCTVWLVDAVDPAAQVRERERALQRLDWLFRNNATGPGSALLLGELRSYRALETP